MSECSKCGLTGCKLWREYQTINPRLLCVDCAGADQGKDVSSVDADGCRPSDVFDGHMTDQIGFYVPAVFADDGNFWGYRSTPDDAIARWRALPTRARQVQP